MYYNYLFNIFYSYLYLKIFSLFKYMVNERKKKKEKNGKNGKNEKKGIKKYTRRILKGGLMQKNPNITSWQAVFKMICVPGATLSVISFKSLKGIIFRLDVPHDPNNSEFIGLNTNRNDLNAPIYTLVFKFAIISNSPAPLPELVIGGNRIYKESDTIDIFMNEARVQQYIYIKTLAPQGRPITISVVDFSYFNPSSSTDLLHQLDGIQSDQMVKIMLNYLLEFGTTNGRYLGLITMELANSNFVELDSIPRLINGRGDIYVSDCNYALAQTLVLFTQLKLMNYDSRLGNILANPEEPTSEGEEERTVLIDFGSTLNFNLNNPFPNLVRPGFFGQRDWKTEIIAMYNQISGSEYYKDLEAIKYIDYTELYRRDADPIIIQILKFLAYIDYAVNRVYFELNNPQMLSLLNHLFPYLDLSRESSAPYLWNTSNKDAVFEKLKYTIRKITQSTISQSNRISNQAIENKVKRGEIFTIDNANIGLYNRSDHTKWYNANNGYILSKRVSSQEEEEEDENEEEKRYAKKRRGGKITHIPGKYKMKTRKNKKLY